MTAAGWTSASGCERCGGRRDRPNSPTPESGGWSLCRAGPGSTEPDPRGGRVRCGGRLRRGARAHQPAGRRADRRRPVLGVVGDRAASGTQQRGKLSAERCRRLEALPGWSWNLAEARWEKTSPRWRPLPPHTAAAIPARLRVIDRCQHCRLATGVRRAARAGSLSTERLKRLQSLPGWSPETRRFRAAWDENYDQLVAYADKHGHAAPGQHYRTASGMALGHWVSNQRAAYRTGRMARDFPDRIGRLEALPGWAWNTF